jgi:hypothetical protein
VVVDGDREGPLGALLADDVLVQDRVDLLRLRQALQLECRRRLKLLVDDLVAEIDALVADIDARPGNQLLDLALRLPAEAAEKLLIGVGWTGQRSLPSGLVRRLRQAIARLARLRYAARAADPSCGARCNEAGRG